MIGRPWILKGVAKYSGDGWKDSTKKGDVVFVYSPALPRPYAAGQYRRVGSPIWTASADQFTFTPAPLWDRLKLIPLLWGDRDDLALLDRALDAANTKDETL